MIDEGRRQLDRQISALEDLRARAQFLFTVALALVAAIGSLAGAIDEKNECWATGVWLFSIALAAYGGLGTAALLAVRADFSTIDTAKLSATVPPVRRSLADSYARMLGIGENTIAARITLFRQAVVYLVLGALLGLSVYLATGAPF
jgi:hypothetical protein